MFDFRLKIIQKCIFGLAFSILGVLLLSCGYRIIGSQSLPFDSITIKQVNNKTYEPKLEDKLHDAFSKEFIAQGIKVKAVDGDADIETTITTFELLTIAAIAERVQEQAIIMKVDIKITHNGRITEFASTESPIRITYRTTGTVIDSVVQKEKAIVKACTEIAREIISKLIIRYAE